MIIIHLSPSLECLATKLSFSVGNTCHNHIQYGQLFAMQYEKNFYLKDGKKFQIRFYGILKTYLLQHPANKLFFYFPLGISNT
jgi:hypothetical protein